MHLCNKYLSSAFSVIGTILDVQYPRVDETDTGPCPHGVHVLVDGASEIYRKLGSDKEVAISIRSGYLYGPSAWLQFLPMVSSWCALCVP